MNPYFGKDFLSFFFTLFSRVFEAFFKKGEGVELVSDEIQILVLMFTSISCSILGAFLILKKKAMLANSLSHTSLLGIVLSYLLMKGIFAQKMLTFNPALFFLASFFTALLTIFLTNSCKKIFKLHEEASVGLIFTFLFALALLLVSLFTKNVHLGVEAIMGNIDIADSIDVKLSLMIALINLAALFLFFNDYKIFCFDETFAKIVGCSLVFLEYLLMIQTSMTAIGAFRSVGVFLFLVFLTAPYLAARLLSSELKKIILYSALISFFSTIFSVAFARHLLSVYDLALSTGALSATCVGASYPILGSALFIKKKILRLSYKEKTKEKKKEESFA